MKFKNVCITSNVRVLFLYLLYRDDNVLEDTFFFIDKIPDSIAENLPNKKELRLKPSLINNLYLSILIRFWRIFQYPFIRKAYFYGQDNIPLSKVIYPHSNMTLIEDGLLSYFYVPQPKKIQNFLIIRKLFNVNIRKSELFGRSQQVKKILMTNLFPIPSDIQNKVELIDVGKLWNESSETKKQLILNIFNFSYDDFRFLSGYKEILLTQPLSEDGAISESEKIEMYKKMIGSRKVVVKPHPRENTDYSKYIPNSVILKKHVPIELYSVLGVEFETAYTIFSTAVYMIPKIKTIVFVGTKNYPKLSSFYGDISYESGMLIGQLSVPK